MWPCEGGHTDYAPRNQVEFDLMNFMRERERVERVSVERIVSGMGLPRIYEFLCERSPQLVSAAIEAEMRTAGMDPSEGSDDRSGNHSRMGYLCMSSIINREREKMG